MSLPALPPTLKPISPYIKLANEYDKRDGVVSYYCRLYCIQKGMSIDGRSNDCKMFLLTLMDILEKGKKDLIAQGQEAVSSELVGQAHVESKALSLFSFADQEDRKSNFNKALVKAFYSANLLFDVLRQFGDISEEITLKQRYAKWKATYIHKCLQTGEQPTPGPQGSEFEGAGLDSGYPDESSSQTPYPSDQGNMPSASDFSQAHSSNPAPYQPPPNTYNPPTQPVQPSSAYSSYQDETSSAAASSSYGSGKMGPDDFQQATKYCKYAVSSLEYEDVSTAIDNLTKALNLLKSKQ